jgi:hypothetical protein
MTMTENADANVPLIVTTNERGTSKPSSSTGTSFDLDSPAYKSKSCRSFVRQSKMNKDFNKEHRNKSVPQNLQVCFCPRFCVIFTPFIRRLSLTTCSVPF